MWLLGCLRIGHVHEEFQQTGTFGEILHPERKLGYCDPKTINCIVGNKEPKIVSRHYYPILLDEQIEEIKI